MDQKEYACHDPRFLTYVGWFHQAWAGAEIAVDAAIGKLLRITDEEAHLLTTGLELNRKATLLRLLLKRSNLEGKSVAIKALDKIQNESKRNVFAHSYMESNRTKVVYRKKEAHGGKFWTVKLEFTVEEFIAHVANLIDASADFMEAMEFTNERLEEFSAASETI